MGDAVYGGNREAVGDPEYDPAKRRTALDRGDAAAGGRTHGDSRARGDGRARGDPRRHISAPDFAAELEASHAAELEASHAAELEASHAAELEVSRLFLAHDLREGLGTIVLFAGALERRLGDRLGPATAGDLDGIRAGIERMRELISASVRPTGDVSDAEHRRDLDANVVVRDALANVHARVTVTGAEIVYEPLPWISGDRPQLTSLFQNLLANSLKFRDPLRPPRILIGARPEANRWRFEIADNGIGMAPDLAERAFEPWRRQTESEPCSGGSLGLAICARIVKAHGGHARAEPRTGGGTTVSFDLPSARAAR